MPLPLPSLVFGNLVQRWNRFSPLPLGPEIAQYVEKGLAVSRYELRSLPVGQKNHAVRIGCVGVVTYTDLQHDSYWNRLLHLLADFAYYSGVGVQTATGMGQVRRLD